MKLSHSGGLCNIKCYIIGSAAGRGETIWGAGRRRADRESPTQEVMGLDQAGIRGRRLEELIPLRLHHLYTSLLPFIFISFIFMLIPNGFYLSISNSSFSEKSFTL